MNCPITGKEMRPLFQHRVLGRYDVAYFYCEESGIIKTEEPYWLEAAYKSVISELDTWTAARNVGNARRLEPILSLLFPKDAVFVDTAGGYGMLTRMMRDIGFNFFGYDRYCENFFSREFVPPRDVKATAVTAFEVLEHLSNPVEFLSEQIQKYNADSIIASTCVFDGKIPDFDWPYYSFESGQHIILYQPRSLRLLAKVLGLNYYMLPGDLHLFAKQTISPLRLFVLRTKFVRWAHAAFTRCARRHRSFTWSDYELVRRRVLAQGEKEAAASQANQDEPVA